MSDFLGEDFPNAHHAARNYAPRSVSALLGNEITLRYLDDAAKMIHLIGRLQGWIDEYIQQPHHQRDDRKNFLCAIHLNDANDLMESECRF